jgi:hypothetical protein
MQSNVHVFRRFDLRPKPRTNEASDEVVISAMSKKLKTSQPF